MNLKPTKTIRVAVVDDHPLILKALQYSLVTEEGLSLVGLYSNRKDVLPALTNNEIDVLVLDYLLGDEEMDGLHLIKQLRSRYPRLKILVSSSVESPAIVQLVIKAGVRGFIGKSQEHEKLIEAIRLVGSGQRYLTSQMKMDLDKFMEADREMHAYVAPHEETQDIKVLIRDLSAREMDVLRCYLDGMTIMQIAAKYSRSRKTISGQKQAALRKLGLRSDLELFKFRDYFD